VIYLKKKTKKILIILAIVLVLGGVLGYQAKTNPRVRLFCSVIHFMTVTLDEPGYLLHDIDIMELCRDYFNADTSISGDSALSGIESVNASISMDIDAKRSFSQKKLSADLTMDFLVFDMGHLIFYAQDDTVYLDAPMLGDKIGYAFPTGQELFPKMPDLTHDIDQEWFQENMSNIITFLRQIGIEETGKTITDESGSSADEFVITIPQGCGQFIWDLLGMEAPDYDVVCSLYLNKYNITQRIAMDLSDATEGLSMMIDGTDIGTAYIYYELPDDERVELVMDRNADYSNWIDCTATYYANTDKQYQITSYMTWQETDGGVSIHVRDIDVTCDDETLATGYFKGEILKENNLPDLFGNQADYLYGLEVIDWKYVRDDSESFIKEVLDKTSFSSILNE